MTVEAKGGPTLTAGLALAAQAANEIKADEIGALTPAPDPFLATAYDGVARRVIPAEGWKAGVKWRSESCLSPDVLAMPCPDCDDETPPEDPEADLDWLVVAQKCDETAAAFKIRHGLRYNDCTPTVGVSAAVVRAKTGAALGQRLALQLATIAAVLQTDAVSIETAAGMLMQARETKGDGSGWFTMSRTLIPAAKSASLLERVGARRELCEQPVLYGGVGVGGPPPIGELLTVTDDQAWMFIHGPVDYALGDVEDTSGWDAHASWGHDSARRFALVRVDSCDVYAIPVSLVG